MINKTSGFEFHYVVNRTTTPTSNNKVQIKKTCDNCFEAHELCYMSNGLEVCKPCSEDIEMLTNRPMGRREE